MKFLHEDIKEVKYIQLKPIFIQKPWGGKILNHYFSLDQKHIGEVFLVSGLKEESNTIEGGLFNGFSLFQIVNDYKELFGLKYSYFPLLIKMIGATQTLSLQVHPKVTSSKEYCFGKDESWYVLKGKNNIYYDLIAKKNFVECLINNTNPLSQVKKTLVKKGDVVDIPGGTVHSLNKGLVVYEVQTPSNITYRLFDYNRLDLDGKLRQLHIKEGIEVLEENKLVMPKKTEILSKKPSLSLVTKTKYYSISRLDQSRSTRLINKSFIIITVIKGSVRFLEKDFTKGNTFIITKNCEIADIFGKCSLLITCFFDENI